MEQTLPAARPELPARLSAVRHGLRSREIVIPGLEEAADWDTFREDAVEALDPLGAVEYALAERAAELLWRLRRVSRAEREAAVGEHRDRERKERETRDRAAATARELGPKNFYASAFADTAARPMPGFEQDPFPRIDLITAISKYEARLNRQFLHTLHELQALQDRRAGRDAPLARIDVTGAGDE